MMELGTDKRYLYCFFGMFFAVHLSYIWLVSGHHDSGRGMPWTNPSGPPNVAFYSEGKFVSFEGNLFGDFKGKYVSF